jgi:dihydrofolate reductase
MSGGQHDRHESDPRGGDLPADLAGPARRALAAAGYTRLEQLTQVSEAELGRLHGMGPKALEQLRRALVATGRSFTDADIQRQPRTGRRGKEAEVQMRKIIAGPFVTLDGVVELSEQWTMPYFSADMRQVIQQGMTEADTMLMGRRTYEQMAAYWPGMSATDDPFAAWLNNSPKLVVSTTLTSVGWQNATLISGDVVGEISRRKQQPGKNIMIPGSATLVRCLLREGLIDELRLLLFPLVLGTGGRLFDDWTDRLPLRLTESRTLEGGTLSLVYEPASA